MCSKTEELQFAIVEAPATVEKEHGGLSVCKAMHGSCLIKLPRSPIGSLPDDEEAMETSISVCGKAKWFPPKKASLQLRKFFYPRFKRRPCGIISLGSQRCSVKQQQKNASSLQVACIPEASPCMISTGLQQMNSSNKDSAFPHEILVEDVVSCESPSDFVRHGKLSAMADKAYSPKPCTATPIPINSNSAFRSTESPFSGGIPRLCFTHIQDQQDNCVALTSRFVPSPYCGKVADVKRTHNVESVLCSSMSNVLLNSSNLTEPQPLESGIWVDEHEKENVPLALRSSSKAVVVYRSLQKRKKRRKLSPGQAISLRQVSHGGAGFLKTRSSAKLDLDTCSRQMRLGPVLRSAQNERVLSTSFGRDKLTKERSLPAYGSKKSLVKALLEKYLRNRRMKCGTPSRREVCLPFLNREAGRRVECFYCKACVTPHESTSCSHKDCKRSYHLTCAQTLEDFHFRKNGDAVCPQHVCMVCKGFNRLKVFRCERCTVAAHKKCLPFPEHTVFLDSKPDNFICWRHPQDWRLESESCCSTRYRRQIQRKFLNDYLSRMLWLSLVSGLNYLKKSLGKDLSQLHLYRFVEMYSLLKRNEMTLMTELAAPAKMAAMMAANAELNP